MLLGISLVVIMAPLAVAPSTTSADAALDTYGYLLGLALVVQCAVLAGMGLTALLQRRLLRFERQWKRIPEKEYQSGIAATIATVTAVIIGVAGAVRVNDQQGNPAGWSMILFATAVLWMNIRARVRAQHDHRGGELFWRVRLGEWSAYPWRSAEPAQRAAALKDLRRLETAVERKARLTTSEGVWGRLHRRNPWVLGLLLLVLVTGTVNLIGALVKDVRGANIEGWPAFLAADLALIGLVPAVVWSWDRLERSSRLRTLGDLGAAAGQVRQRIAALPSSRVLILTASIVERDAVLEAVRAVNGACARPQFKGATTAFALGGLSAAQVEVAQSAQEGTGSAGGMTLTAVELLEAYRPDYVILAGVCCGLQEEKQRIGDIVISGRVHDLDHRKLVDTEQGRPAIHNRGENVAPSPTLLDRCGAAELDWPGAALHFGLLLSSNTVLGSRTQRAWIKKTYPDAVGMEMGGAGIYAAAARERTDWIVVKGIVGWCADGSEESELAARHAAEFVIHLVNTGALDQPPGHPRPST